MTTTVRWVAAITAAIVLIQAVLIGQALYMGDASRFALHGWLGNLSFIGAIVLAGLTWVATRRGELPREALWLGILVAVLMVAQIGLGYSGRGGGVPAALHIPNGVLVASLLTALLTVVLLPSRASQTRS
ncbi:MAG: hypothetical protein ACRDJC_17355 [Thermomicrobiales bacterium]